MSETMVQLAPTCTVCGERISVPIKALIDGMIIGVCEDCLKYGKRVEITDVDKQGHCSLIESFWIGSE